MPLLQGTVTVLLLPGWGFKFGAHLPLLHHPLARAGAARLNLTLIPLIRC